MTNGAVILILGVLLIFVIWYFCFSLVKPTFRPIEVHDPQPPIFEEPEDPPVIECGNPMDTLEECMIDCRNCGFTTSHCQEQCTTGPLPPGGDCGSPQQPFKVCMHKCTSCGYTPSHCRHEICSGRTYLKHPQAPCMKQKIVLDKGCGC